MKDDNVIVSKSFDFAVRIVKLYKHIVESKKEYVLSKQILKSGTSIGANIEEAIGGVSRADFINKISIAYKEARETDYWLRLFKATDYLNEVEFESIHADATELLRILTSILNTSKCAEKATTIEIDNNQASI
ncbi:MAG: four helix bundle protein [Planctomycetes bacterium]|nr:four helix bundle protein [Planctomycetota bacterium]